jgi:hypothetical protein
LFFICGCASAAQSKSPSDKQTIQVLFIGNSYTFSNDLPEIIKSLVESSDYIFEFSSLAYGGWTLSKHAQSSDTLETIRQGNWDFVVLQEHSLIPTKPKERKESMYPAIRTLHTEIEKINATTILFMTWGYREGFPQLGFNNFFEMQSQLSKGYLDIANELNITVAPVGEVWKNALIEDLTIDLWQSDGRHPNITGSYLTACVFYAVILQETPEGLDYLPSLEENVGFTLQSVAAQTVLQDLARWNIE